MERLPITSVINGIIRNHFDSEVNTLYGIALWLCRRINLDLNRRPDFFNRDIVFENLFQDGEDAAQKIEKHVPQYQLDLLAENYALTAENLLLRSCNPGLKSDQLSFPISEPTSIFLFSFLRPKDGSVVYNPFGGDYYAPERNPEYYFDSPSMESDITAFSLLYQATGRRAHNSKYYDFNPFLYPTDNGQEYDSIYIPAMPYGIRYMGYGRKQEETYLLNVLKQLRDGGKMLFVLPAIALSGEAFFELRKTLVESRLLRRVILLPSKALSPDSAVNNVAFLVENTRNEKPCYFFHDLTKLVRFAYDNARVMMHKVVDENPKYSVAIEYSSTLSTSNVQIFAPSASVQRTVRPGFMYVKLRELLTVYHRSVGLDGSELVARLSGKDMHLKLPDYEIDFEDMEISPAKGRFTRIERPVLCFHGITRNYAWCVGSPGQPVYCNGDIYTFTISSNLITPEYLCFALGLEDVKADIDSRIGGSGIPRIPRQSLLDVAIPVPDGDRQDLITERIQQFLSEQKTMLASLEKRTHEAKLEDIREDIQDKIHLLGPYNANVQLGINRVIRLLQRGESLDADTKVYRDSEIGLLAFLKGLLVKSEDAGYIMSSIGGSIFEEAQQPLDALVFIQEYVARLQSDNQYEGISFEISSSLSPCYVMITERSLRLVLDTIVRNAVLHGFAGASGLRRIQFGLATDFQSGFATISVANNGLPAAEGFTQSLYEGKFGKCGPTANTGRGGYFVSRAMAFYKGSVIVSTGDRDWPFIVMLHIPLSHD